MGKTDYNECLCVFVYSRLECAFRVCLHIGVAVRAYRIRVVCVCVLNAKAYAVTERICLAEGGRLDGLEIWCGVVEIVGWLVKICSGKRLTLRVLDCCMYCIQ